MASKSIVIILTYTVSKLGRFFLRHSVGVTFRVTATKNSESAFEQTVGLCMRAYVPFSIWIAAVLTMNRIVHLLIKVLVAISVIDAVVSQG